MYEMRATLRGQLITFSYDVKLYVGDVPLASLAPARLAALYKQLDTSGRKDHREGEGLSERTVRYVHTILGAALADAVDAGLIMRNPAASPKQAKPPTRPGARDHRRAPVGGIVRSKGQPSVLTESTTKNKQSRVVDIEPETAALLKSWKKDRGLLALARDDALVFGDLEVQHLHPERFSRTFTATTRRCIRALGDGAPCQRSGCTTCGTPTRHLAARRWRAGEGRLRAAGPQVGDGSR